MGNDVEKFVSIKTSDGEEYTFKGNFELTDSMSYNVTYVKQNGYQWMFPHSQICCVVSKVQE